jgi:succinate dehydrogenase hydrophobic anchor subunit
MSLISLIAILIFGGVLIWVVEDYIPKDGKIRIILNIIAVICFVIWLLFACGIFNHSSAIPIPQAL